MEDEEGAKSECRFKVSYEQIGENEKENMMKQEILLSLLSLG